MSIEAQRVLEIFRLPNTASLQPFSTLDMSAKNTSLRTGIAWNMTVTVHLT